MIAEDSANLVHAALDPRPKAAEAESDEGSGKVQQLHDAVIDVFDTPRRYEVNIAPKKFSSVQTNGMRSELQTASGCFLWKFKLRLPADELDPRFLRTGMAVRLSFLESSTIVWATASVSAYAPEAKRPFLHTTQMIDASIYDAVDSGCDAPQSSPKCIFVIERVNKHTGDFREETVRWNRPYRLRHIQSDAYLALDPKTPPDSSNAFLNPALLSQKALENADEYSDGEEDVVTKFMFVPAHSPVSDDDRVRCDSAVGRLMLVGTGEHHLYLCDTGLTKPRSKKKKHLQVSGS